MTRTDSAAIKRRARRIASDEAHAWARNLRLGNPLAKLVLSMVTIYVDGDGTCWVSLAALADDTELSINTVRDRLTWLEDIGAIARLPQWLDANGRRNGDGQGKRTSDLIRLLLDADPDFVEARARGEIVNDEAEISPPPRGGLNSAAVEASPPPALRQPSNCAEGLISEPEPESPSSPPLGDERELAQSDFEGSEPADFEPSWQSWRGHQVMRRDLALAEFRILTAEQQRLCRAAIAPFFELQDRLNRKTVPNFHLWIRQRGFEQFPGAKLPEPPPQKRFVQGDELAGLMVAGRMASRQIQPVIDAERGLGVWTVQPVRPDLAAMAQFHDDDPERWAFVERGSEQCAAWRERLSRWLGGEVEVERIWLEDYDPAVHGLPAMDRNFRLRKSTYGLRIPAPWPPRVDGSWRSEGGGS
jgi:hypothetical protein